MFVKAIESYNSELREDLEFEKGEILLLLERPFFRFVFVKNKFGSTGMVPLHLVKSLDSEERSNGIERLAFTLNNNCAITPSSANKLPMMSTRTKAVVKFTYEPRLEDELGLTKGDFVFVVEKSTDGWWKGEANTGATGWFPSNYVEEVEQSANGNQGSIENRNPSVLAPQPIQQQQAPAAARASLEIVVALYSFEASSSEELSFKKGERLEIVDHPAHYPDLWMALNSLGFTGLVPRNYIEVVNDSSSSSTAFQQSHGFGTTTTPGLVVYPYIAQNHDELSVCTNEVVFVQFMKFNRSSVVTRSGRRGYVPLQCLCILEMAHLEDEESKQKTSTKAEEDFYKDLCGARVLVMTAFKPIDTEKLTVRQGETLIIEKMIDNNMAYAKNVYDIHGLIPLSIVKIIREGEIPMEQEPWYFGRISRDRAEELLLQGRDGEFLVRDSESKTGEFQLSITTAGKYLHVKVFSVCGLFVVWHRTFMNMNALIAHYTTNPIFSSPTEMLYLTGPLSK